MPPKKKNAKPQKSAIDKDFRLQAVILADSYQSRFQPLTKDYPRCLLPLANTPLLEYTFEFLAKAGVREVFLMCCSHADKIEEYIKQSKWSDSHSPFEIHTKKLTESMSVGDAMRDLDGTGSITSDFLLVSGDVVSNIDFTPVLEQHLQRKQDDKNAMMTMVLRQADAFHRTRSRIEPGLFVLNDKTSECLRYEELSLNNPTGSIDLDGELLNDDATLSIRNDLIDCHIDLCSIDVLAQFTENFDYSTLRSDFVKNILTSEILGKKIYAHIVTDAYAARVRSLQTYSAVTKDIVSRYSYPVVPDSNLMDDQTFSYQMGHIYKEKGVVLAQSCVIGSRSLVGRGTSVGEKSLVKDTVIGRDCKIATNVNLVDSFIWSNVTIEDDVTVKGALVADDAILKKGCSIGPGSIIGHGVTVAEGQKIEGAYLVLDGEESVPFDAVDEDDSDYDTDDEFNANVGSLVYNLKELNLSDTSINDHCYEDDENIRAVAPKKKTRRRLSSTVSNVSDNHEDEFQKEAIASLDRAFQENHEIDIAALELGTLRMSSNVPYEEVRAASVKAINGYITRVLNMGVTDDHKVPTQKVWGKWAELFEKQVFEPADQIDLLNILLKDCSRRPVGNYILFAAVQSLYDADVLDEHVIVRWWHQQPEDVSPEIASVRTLLGKWITWLEEAESESEEETMFVWPSTTRNKAKYTGYGPPNYSRDRLNSNGFSESYSTTPSSVSLNTDYRQHLGFTSSRYRSGGNDCCSSDQGCDHDGSDESPGGGRDYGNGGNGGNGGGNDKGDNNKHNRLPPLPTIDGYGPLVPIVPQFFHSNSFYRSVKLSTGQPVLVTVSAEGTLEDLIRVSYEWQLLRGDVEDEKKQTETTTDGGEATRSDSFRDNLTNKDWAGQEYSLPRDLAGILRPSELVQVSSEPPISALIFDNNEKLMTLREKFLDLDICEEEEVSPIRPLNPELEATPLNPKVANTNGRQKSPVKLTISPATANGVAGAGVGGAPTPFSPTPFHRTKDEILEILRAIISVLTTIAEAHQHNITHHGLNPGRIFLNEKGETFISSWDFSFCLRVEDPAKGYRRTHIKQMGNNMYYVSPETTGEMNRLVDFRADFYSIGCILYELLIGSPPFKSADPLELGYMHVSCAPVAPQLLASWVPEQLGAVVMKLLEKNSDSRYQTAESIISDLEYIYDCLEKDVKLDNAFEPASGSTNVLSRFLVPQLIYGRDSEITTMSTVYEKLLEKGCAQMIVVRGDPGIGKSRLVYELEKSVIARHGYFAMAKFDQYQRVPPFYTTITILNDLIHQLLSASQTTILNWRERILTNIKVDMSVLFGPIPELRQLVGPDYHDIVPEGPPLGPVKRELRIKYLVKSLFCLFGVFGLAIFLDDIQWCFPTDFEFFVELQSFAKENHFDDVRVTLVCSAICNDDPLASKCNFLLDIIKQTDAPFVEIALQPLAKEAVRQIIAQTLSIRPAIAGSSERRASVSRKSSFTYDTDVSTTSTSAVAVSSTDPQVESLTDTVYRITEGNPLFISCLLRYLYYRGYIYLDQNTRGGNSNIGKWKVDFDMLLSHTLPRSVQETTISMYESLPPLTYKIIRYAACICSNTFTLEDLALSLEISFSEAAEALYPALEVELILPTTLHYKFPFSKADGELNLTNDQIRQIARQAKYRFYHDLVQQSVYFHIDDNEKAEIHRQIGLRLLGKHDAKKMPAHKVLEIATQLRKALTIVRDDEKIIYRDLNIQAGHLVFDMTDFDMAFRFFDVAKKLLPPDPWKHHEAITRDIYLSLMELQFLRKKHQSCLELIDQVFPHCTDIMDQAQCLKTKVKALSAVKKKDEAIAASLEVLALLGFHLQEDEEWNEKNYSILRHRIPLSVGEIRDLAHNPVTKDVRMLLAHEVIFITLIPVLLSNRKHFIRSLTLVAVTAFLDYGSSSVCAFSLLTLASHFQKDGGSINLTRAYEYSKLAIVTLECDSTVNLDFGMNTYEYYVLTLAIYFEPLSEVIRYYDIVMKTGQTIYDPHGTVAFSLGLRPMCKFLAGESLQSIHTMFVNLEASTTQLDHRISRLWLKIHTQAILNLMGDGHNDPSCLEGELLGNKEDVEEIMSSKAEEVQYAYNVCRLLLAVVYKHKYVASDIILHDLKYTMTTLPVTVYHVIVTFYGALAIIDSEGRYSEESEPLLEQFARDLEDWSATCPSTFLHKHLCIKAELHKHTCDSIITLDTYEEAIQAALKEGFLQDAAVINERCGDWLQTHSKNRSVAYYQEAAKFYGAWGARLKVNQLVHKYPEIQSSNYELNHLTLLTNTSASSNAYYSDLRARSSLISNSVLVQSPLRWILSSLLREEENKEQIPTKDMTPNALQALAVNDESEVITSPLIMQGIGAGKVMNQQGEESSGRVVLDHNTKHTQMLKGKKTDEQDVKSALQACLDISEAIDTTSIVRKLIESVLVIGGADYAVFISLDDDGGLYVDSVGVLNTITQIRHEPLISRSDLAPMSVIQHVLITGTPISRQADTRKFDTVHGRDHFFYNRSYQSVLCMPIQNQIKSVGILYLEHQHNFRVFSLQRIELISLLCTQAAVSMEKARLYHQMDLAKKAAEEATAEKASFLANMSHEIRTPFNALLSCSIFLMDTNLTVVQREYVDTIRSSAMLTLNIIDAILAFSKIEHGSIDLENSPFSLRECIESAIQLVAEPAATKDLELVHLNRCGEVDIVNGDVTRFRQIVINLVGNAVKFTSKGYIVVESHAERVSSDHRYEFVISVTDTGIGIPKNARDKVFRAFSQVDGSARRVFGGSGLGLAISKKLAELMGGGLTFDSVEGEGTTFWFSLVARAQEPSKDKVSIYEGKKVILADSHAMEKESLHTELERLGFEITCCDDSSEARKIVLENPTNTFALVFIDARSVPHDSNDLHDISNASPITKCLLMSHFGVPMAEDFQQQGYSAILMRPIQRSRLADIIKRLLDDQTSSDAKKALKSAPNEKGMLQSLAERHPLKILLAEDNIINTRVALQHLKRMGYNAEHAKDGVEVLRMCQREIDAGRPMYDCVLMDIQMPNKDGIAASQELKELYKDDCPNVIALTANAGGEDRRKCLDAGMVSYLAKPILPADLAAVLMSVQVAERDTKKVEK